MSKGLSISQTAMGMTSFMKGEEMVILVGKVSKEKSKKV